MAAKQGTLAQLSAQAEDAKRAVLSKAGASSWFSNLNTVCTIKSAPPRTPEVLQMLATKAGWLYKRNEQHVWQARWCCVVPHTFFYYFDAPAGSSAPTVSGSGPGPAQQEEWNHAVLYGLGDRKPHEKRSHFPLFHGSTSGPATVDVSSSANAQILNDDHETGIAPPNGQNLPPAGIIDLECYSTIHRSSENGAILQLAGDDQVNPDLRPFYFCCDNPQEVEEWSNAILNDRHAALQDEVDAFKYVADSFAERLDLLYAELNDSKTQQEESEQILYRVRSAAEETCRTVYRMAEDCLERAIPVPSSSATLDIDPLSLQEKRTVFRRNLESVRQQDLGVNSSVRLIVDYIAVVEDMCSTLHHCIEQLQSDVQKSDLTDQAEIQELQKTFENSKKEHLIAKEQLLQELAAAQTASQAATKELKDVQENLNSTKMEVTMLMSQQRNKLATQLQHKKILKKEVIDLRQKVEDVVSDHSTLQHECEKLKLQLQQERSKNDLLTRYMAKMESQVQVQQNMMEMMSQAGGSVYGGVGGMSVTLHPTNVARSDGSRNRRIERRGSVDAAEDEDMDDFNNDEDCLDDHELVDEDFENDERMLLQPPNIPMSPPQRGSGRRRRMSHATYNYSAHRRGSSFVSDNDVDNKSHVSELTEDRTQREFAAFQHSQHQLQPTIQLGAYSLKGGYSGGHQSGSDNFQSDARSRKRVQEQVLARSPRPITAGPPAVIIGVKKNDSSMTVKDGGSYLRSNQIDHKLDTISNNVNGSVKSLPATRPNVSTPMYRPNDDMGVNNGNGRLDAVSVASSVNTMDSESKVSIAQQARLAADLKSTPVRVRLDEKSLSSLQKKSSDANLEALANIGVIPNASSPSRVNTSQQFKSGQQAKHSSPQNSQGSGLWRRVEEAVLGPRSDDDESYSSEGSTRITDTTDEGNNVREQAKRRFASGSSRIYDEKKSSDSVASISVCD
jgi:hypothetical protein